MRTIPLLIIATWTAWFLGSLQSESLAQSSSKKPKIGGLSLGADLGIPCDFSAVYELEKGSNRGTIRITATPDAGYHIYSVTQPDGGPLRTKIKPGQPDIKVLGSFEPDVSPHETTEEAGFEGKIVELHDESVTWTATFELATPVTGEPQDQEWLIDGQVCITNGSCTRIPNKKVKAMFGGYYGSAKEEINKGPFRDKDSPSEWTVTLSKSKVKSGDSVDLIIRGVPDKPYYFYKYDSNDEKTLNRTLLFLKQKGGMKAGRPIVSQTPKHKVIGGDQEIDYYDGAVEWRIPLRVPTQSIPTATQIVGLVGYQACTEESCDQPRGIEFRADIEITDGATDSSPVLAALKPVAFNSIAELPKRNKWFDDNRIALTLSARELLSKFCLAMLGGLILNVMPCVLPVIGLKVLGFVSEARGDKRSASLLTLTYAAGIISLIVFLGLMSVTVRQITGTAYGWGEQFGSLPFRIVTTAFMFSLALSFLGIWEIPIPGFATGGKGAQLAGREGYTGAFFKGLITTVLATPCSAPFLGGVFVVALSQPSWVVLLIFFGVGLGMALPYLLLSLEPRLLSFIPKPGPWMETFKEFLAFPMLLAVVMFVDGFAGDQKIAMLGSLMFVWFGCWMIGRVPAWTDFSAKFRSWGLAALIAVIGTLGSFYVMQPSPYRLAWVSYREEALDDYVKAGKTVLIDFTAEWCQNCKLNLNQAIHTKKVKELVEKNNVVAMVADLTDYPPHIKEKLNELGSISIPVLAIYRPGDTESPIVLPDLVREKDVLEALEKAGPSQQGSSTVTKTASAKVDPSNGLD
jgi:thiol:disulfide interchange protein